MPSPSTIDRPRRRLRPARLAGPALAAALVFGSAACGGSDGGGSLAGGGDFCGSMKALDQKYSDPGTADPKQMSAMFSELSKLTPPAELADDWHTMLSAKDFLDDPTSMSSDKVDAFTKASDHIDAYVKNTCHIKG